MRHSGGKSERRYAERWPVKDGWGKEVLAMRLRLRVIFLKEGGYGTIFRI
jgi:hypothetical protein